MVASITPSPLFLSTPSARRATCRAGSRRIYRPISIHALREEGDGTGCRPVMSRLRFLSTPSARRATRFASMPSSSCWRFLSTPSARRATTQDKIATLTAEFLSTPSARRATAGGERMGAEAGISIHALREEGDLPFLGVCGRAKAFLSTPSARRATYRA